MKKISLEKITIHCRKEISLGELEDIPHGEWSAWMHPMRRVMILELHSYIWGKRKTFEEVRWPSDWKEAFKERWFPKWLLEYCPVRYEIRQYDAIAAFPNLKTDMPGGERQLNFLEMR
jgi:hypothetical protein